MRFFFQVLDFISILIRLAVLVSPLIFLKGVLTANPDHNLGYMLVYAIWTGVIFVILFPKMVGRYRSSYGNSNSQAYPLSNHGSNYQGSRIHEDRFDWMKE